MKRSERTYDQLFGLLRDTSPATSFTTEEIRSLIEKQTAEGGRSTRPYFSRRIAVGATLLAVTLATVGLFRMGGPEENRPTADRIAAISPKAATADAIPEPHERGATPAGAPQLHSAEKPLPAATPSHAGHGTAPELLPRSARSRDDGSKRERSAGHPLRDAGTQRDATHPQEQPPHDIVAPPDITATPMLELTPEELKPPACSSPTAGSRRSARSITA